jgi:hypothetical protein
LLGRRLSELQERIRGIVRHDAVYARRLLSSNLALVNILINPSCTIDITYSAVPQ